MPKDAAKELCEALSQLQTIKEEESQYTYKNSGYPQYVEQQTGEDWNRRGTNFSNFLRTDTISSFPKNANRISLFEQ